MFVVKVSEFILVLEGGEEGRGEGMEEGSAADRCNTSMTSLPGTTPSSVRVVVLERVSSVDGRRVNNEFLIPARIINFTCRINLT